MSSVAPYLIRAYHEWMEDSALTAHILVDCSLEDDSLVVPSQYIQDGKIVLNISTTATEALTIDHEQVRFKARFGGVSQQVIVPMSTIASIYAAENGEGMFFETKPNTSTEAEEKPNLTLLD